MPGEHTDEVEAHLVAALGADLLERLEVEILMDDAASTAGSTPPCGTPCSERCRCRSPTPGSAQASPWGSPTRRVFRELGAISYGAGLYSPALDPGEFALRFHGNDERVDVESLRLTTELWERVITDLMSWGAGVPGSTRRSRQLRTSGPPCWVTWATGSTEWGRRPYAASFHMCTFDV